MSVSGAVLILVTIVLRALFLHKLPKRTFLVLWSVVLVRLLVPYSLPTPFSAYSLLSRINTQVPTNFSMTITPPASPSPTITPDISAIDPAQTPQATQVDITTTEALSTTVDLFTAVWFAGFLILFVFFAISYINSIRKFSQSLPVNDKFVIKWLGGHRSLRKISVRQSDMISTPLTYGIFRPVILLPKKLVQDEASDHKSLNYVLSHEFLHIKRFDALLKLVLTAALCVHWFNPLMWVMYVIANRDIEISCDEAVITMLGESEKTDYAMALIHMEEKKCSAAPLITHFNKHATKERIVNIMKFKKTTALAIISAAFLTLGTTAAFATSAKTDKSDDQWIKVVHNEGFDLFAIPEDQSGSDVQNAEPADDWEFIPNGVADYVPGEPETLEKQFKDILLNCTDPERRMNVIFKAVQMGLTADDFADFPLSDDELAVLRGEVPQSWWRSDEPVTGRRVMTVDGEADSSEMVNKSDTSGTSEKLPPAYLADEDDPRLKSNSELFHVTGIPYVVDYIDGKSANEPPPKDNCHFTIIVYPDAMYFYPIPADSAPTVFYFRF